MLDKTNRLDKIDKSISSLIDQIDYLTTEIQIDKIRDSRSKQYDPIKDKIRANSDIIWQLSNSLTHLLSIKDHLKHSDKTTLVDLGLGTSPKGDK